VLPDWHPRSRPQPRDVRGRYARRPGIPPVGWLFCILFAVVLVIAVNV
jgi:hypothetical protein